jgi:ribosomal protein S18 acetylase RimI-like enzyme
VDYRLETFDRADAATVLSWARSADEREAWAAISEPDPGPETFDRWHADTDVHAFGLLADGRLAGYGEVWVDREEDEAELARLIVDPDVRDRGVGRTMVRLLLERARDLGYDDVWVRVVPSNARAIRAYAAAGFVRTTPEAESSFNEGQPRAYVWMRLATNSMTAPHDRAPDT